MKIENETYKKNMFLGSGRSFENVSADHGNDQVILDDLQNIIRTGYKNCSRRTYLIRIEDETKQIDKNNRLQVFKNEGVISPFINDNSKLPQESRSVIGRLNQLIESVKKLEFSCISLDIGFTFSGLEILKVRKELREVFCRKAPAFYGNAFSRAQKHLGDTGLSDAQHWCKPYQDKVIGGGFHIALVAHFPYVFNLTSPEREPLENKIYIQKFEENLAKILLDLESVPVLSDLLNGKWVEVSIPLGEDGKEHFGYHDGITAPLYSNKILPTDHRGFRSVHAVGEILLGHKRNDGDNLYADLGLSRKKNAKIGLQAIPANQVKNEFFKNSSFGVLRKMEQRVEKFNAWVKHQAESNFKQDAALGLPSNTNDLYSYSKNLIRSKVMGRTPTGTLLIPGMTIKDIRDDIVKPVINGKTVNLGEEGGFHRHDADGEIASDDDSQGRACPFSSHIRRMNPRDDPVTPFIHRPVLRRGMPYTEKDSKGLFGLFICADIEEQFEHLVGAWANNRVLGIPDDSTCKDPIIGNHEPQNNVLYLYSHPDTDKERNKISFDEPFVITRGCAYIWFPSISVLKNFRTYTNPFAR